jgi:hypothetical protein
MMDKSISDVDAPHVFYNDVQTYSFFTTQIVLIPGEQK